MRNRSSRARLYHAAYNESVTLFAVFVVYVGLLYVLGRGLSHAFKRPNLAPSVEAVTRVLLGVAAAVLLIFIMRGAAALSLP